jgi:hypothetical protein
MVGHNEILISPALFPLMIYFPYVSQKHTFTALFPLMGNSHNEPESHIFIDPLTHNFKRAINSLFNAIS